jgi:hypothetical protein
VNGFDRGKQSWSLTLRLERSVVCEEMDCGKGYCGKYEVKWTNLLGAGTCATIDAEAVLLSLTEHGGAVEDIDITFDWITFSSCRVSISTSELEVENERK